MYFVRRIKIFAFLSLFLAICVFSGSGRADADIFYAVSNYSTGSAGVVSKNGSAFAVEKNLVSNFGVDAWGFTFKNADGVERAMIREYHYGPNDSVYIYDTSDWNAPPVNKSGFGSNIHAIAAGGANKKYLYLTTYESYAGSGGDEDTGEVVRVDMENGFTRDKAYQYKRFTSDAGNITSPHAEAVHIEGGKIYVLYGMPYNGVTQYEASEIVEFDAELNRLRSVKLEDESGKTGKNAVRMAAYGGKLYVACMGGYQGPNSWGDIWEVDTESMTARQALDGRDMPYELPGGETAAVGMYGVQFASDGTAYILTGSYSQDLTFRSRLFVTTAAKLAGGDAGTGVGEISASYQKQGFSWEILYDEKDATLWCMTGRELEARDKAGNLTRAFTPSELGDNIYSIALLDDYEYGGDGNDGESGSSGGGCDSGAGIGVLFGLICLAVSRKTRVSLLTILSIILCALPLFSATGEAATVYDVKFRVTRGADIRAFEKTRHFYPFTEYALTKSDSEGGYDVYTGKLPLKFHYEAGGAGFLKQARVIYLKDISEEQAFTVETERLDASHREDNGFMQDGVYFNVNDARHLTLQRDATFKLLPIRVWQAMEGFTENYFIEPDYRVEVLGDSSAISYEWKGSPGSEYAELRGLRAGVAVLRITYDPIRLYHTNGGSTYFNATAPADAGIVVVSVVDGFTTDVITPGRVTTNISAREYDTIYFDKGQTDHAEYTFKPSGPDTGKNVWAVRVHRPVHQGGAVWGEGWADGRENAEGGFTVDLYEGGNIVEVSSSRSGKEYHVVNAKGVEINITNGSDAGWKKGDPPRPGDELEISFDGIKTPLEKIAAIYNPGYPDTCYVSYRTGEGNEVIEVRSEGVQYNLSENNAIRITVPRSGTVRLTNGVINCGHMGDPLGSHRDPAKVLGAGLDPNFNAVNMEGVYCVLPDISLGAAGDSSEEPGGGGCDAGAAGLIAFFAGCVSYGRLIRGARGKFFKIF